MKDISLKDLLEAGCHFGHKVTRWHPKAASFIYQSREGIHIIDLVKTRDSLKKAAEYFHEQGKKGKDILMIASKRQAKGVVSEVAKRAQLPYMTNRWIGGFLTNWEEVKKNIEKMNRMRGEKEDGSWKEYPKHEVVKLTKNLRRIESVYAGVANIDSLPEAVFIVDINKEISSVKEAVRCGVKIVAIVDTNSNPVLVNYPIPANDDAVGSIQYIVSYLVESYLEGKEIAQKAGGKKEGTKDKKGEDKKQKTDDKKQVTIKKEEDKMAKTEDGDQKEMNEKKEEEKKEKPKESVKPKVKSGKKKE